MHFVKLFNEMSLNEMLHKERFSEIQRKMPRVVVTYERLIGDSINQNHTGDDDTGASFCKPVCERSANLIKELNLTNIE